MDIDRLKKHLQNHLSDGLVVIVGSGLSVAEGIPGMPTLAAHLLKDLPAKVPATSASTWNTIAQSLKAGIDLESALLANRPDPDLEELIATATADLIGPAEIEVFRKVLSGTQVLRFSQLLPHLLKPPTGIPVVTTNYDRIIELSAELCGLGVDTLFVGHRAGQFSPKESRLSQCRSVVEKKVSGRTRACLEYAPYVRVLKPHGSLDWYQGPTSPLNCSLPIPHPRLMITPGLNKYRGGYDPPFDAHREAANREIDKASRFLILGYGFNDEHLQTHLEPLLTGGKPAVLLTRDLSPNARTLIPKCSGMMSIVREATGKGSEVFTSSSQHSFPTLSIWDLDSLVKEVLRP